MCDYMPYYMPFLLEILHGGGGITTRGFSIKMLAYRVYVYDILSTCGWLCWVAFAVVSAQGFCVPSTGIVCRLSV